MKKKHFTIKYHPNLLFELQEIVHYYNYKHPQLGARFYKNTIEKTLKLKDNPFIYATKYDNIRCVAVPKFPYLIHYEIDEIENIVYIHAVISMFRNPKQHWKK